EYDASCIGRFQQPVHGTDETPVGGDIDRYHLLPCTCFDVVERRKRSENSGIGNEHIQPPETLVQSEAEPINPGIVPEVEAHQGRCSARGLDRVVEFLETADCACQRHDVCAG